MPDEQPGQSVFRSVVVRLPLSFEQERWLRLLAQFEGVSLGEMIARAWKETR